MFSRLLGGSKKKKKADGRASPTAKASDVSPKPLVAAPAPAKLEFGKVSGEAKIICCHPLESTAFAI